MSKFFSLPCCQLVYNLTKSNHIHLFWVYSRTFCKIYLFKNKILSNIIKRAFNFLPTILPQFEFVFQTRSPQLCPDLQSEKPKPYKLNTKP